MRHRVVGTVRRCECNAFNRNNNNIAHRDLCSMLVCMIFGRHMSVVSHCDCGWYRVSVDSCWHCKPKPITVSDIASSSHTKWFIGRVCVCVWERDRDREVRERKKVPLEDIHKVFVWFRRQVCCFSLRPCTFILLSHESHKKWSARRANFIDIQVLHLIRCAMRCMFSSTRCHSNHSKWDKCSPNDLLVIILMDFLCHYSVNIPQLPNFNNFTLWISINISSECPLSVDRVAIMIISSSNAPRPTYQLLEHISGYDWRSCACAEFYCTIFHTSITIYRITHIAWKASAIM